MADDFSSLRSRLAKYFPTAVFEFSSACGSSQKDYRETLRKKLFEYAPDRQVLDLQTRPRLQNGFASISHCPNLGGFVYDVNPIGLDIEATDRVEKRITDRILHQEDAPAPSPAALWAAKEAVFKAFSKENQPPVVSQISIKSWKQSAPNEYIFQSGDGQGVVLSYAAWTIAVFSPVSKHSN